MAKSNAANWSREDSVSPAFTQADSVFSPRFCAVLRYPALELKPADARVVQAYEAVAFLRRSQLIESWVVQPAARLLMSDWRLDLPPHIRRAAAAQLSEESNHTIKQWFMAEAIEATWPSIRADGLSAYIRQEPQGLTSPASDERILGRGIAVELIEGAVLNGQSFDVAAPMQTLLSHHAMEEAIHRLFALYQADAVAWALRSDERGLEQFARGLAEGANIYATPSSTASRLALCHLGWPPNQARLIAEEAAERGASEARELVNKSLKILEGTNAAGLVGQIG
ncbi:MAG: hypothetical protein QM756_43190 [Polyangiaceae bacterium]